MSLRKRKPSGVRAFVRATQADFVAMSRFVRALERLAEAGRELVGEPRRYMPGLCQVCGCTELSSCPEGCGWANDDETLCTVCAPSPRGVDLVPRAHTKRRPRPRQKGGARAKARR